MAEVDTVAALPGGPNTIATLVTDLRRLGVEAGMTLLVHSSLSAMGWVCGGPVAVILALESLLTETGTLVMPTHSGDYGNPEHWENPAVPSSWWDIIRSERPLFDSDLTPTRGMGIIAETFRKQSGVLRSTHPTASFAAWGKNKERIVQDTKLDFAQDSHSPLGRVYELDGSVLLLGVGYDKNTSLHLAEYRANFRGKRFVSDDVQGVENGARTTFSCRDLVYFPDDFPEIGEAFEHQFRIAHGFVGLAKSHLFSQRSLVDFAVGWMEKNRSL